MRTSLRSELEALTGFSQHWKKRATPHGRSWWVLTLPARRTSENGCGLWGYVPTPTKTEYGSNQGGAAGRTGKVRQSLVSRMVPSPRANKWGQVDSHGRPMLHTPTAKANSASPSMAKWPGAPANYLPTTRSTDGERGGRGDLIQAIRGNPNKHYKPLPTPVNQGQSGAARWEGGAGGRKRLQEIGMLPSPAARDWRSGKASPETMARNSRPSNETLAQRSMTGPAVLAAIYAWLMDCPPRLLACSCLPQATALWSVSQKRSATPSDTPTKKGAA